MEFLRWTNYSLLGDAKWVKRGMGNIVTMGMGNAERLDYSLVAVNDISAKDYDGIILVSHNAKEADIPDVIKTAIIEAEKLDKNFHETVSILKIDLPAKKLIYSPTGALNSDYHDVRSYGEAAKKGILRALKSGVEKPLVALVNNPKFPKVELVSLLAILEGLYVTLQHKELCPEVSPKVKTLGVWSKDLKKLAKIIETAKYLESGRIVARDIGGSDPERMAPPKVEEYVKKAFPASSGIKIEVITSEDAFLKDYPLFAAVNRAASVIDRHKGRIMFLTYEGSNVQETLFIVGKGVTYDTGGADIKTGGAMIGMSRDKCGSAAVAGFMKILSYLKPANLKVVGVMSMVRNSCGENCYVADEIIKARTGVKVRVGNTDAEGRMIMADVLCHVKEMALKSKNPHLFTIATLTGHAVRTVGDGYTISLDNGVARETQNSQKLQSAGDEIGDMIEVSTIRREDFATHKGAVEGEDVLQATNRPSTQSNRGHQAPSAFLILASGLDKHGLDSEKPLRFTHLDIAASGGDVPNLATGAPILALVNKYLSI